MHIPKRKKDGKHQTSPSWYYPSQIQTQDSHTHPRQNSAVLSCEVCGMGHLQLGFHDQHHQAGLACSHHRYISPHCLHIWNWSLPVFTHTGLQDFRKEVYQNSLIHVEKSHLLHLWIPGLGRPWHLIRVYVQSCKEQMKPILLYEPLILQPAVWQYRRGGPVTAMCSQEG